MAVLASRVVFVSGDVREPSIVLVRTTASAGPEPCRKPCRKHAEAFSAIQNALPIAPDRQSFKPDSPETLSEESKQGV